MLWRADQRELDASEIIGHHQVSHTLSVGLAVICILFSEGLGINYVAQLFPSTLLCPRVLSPPAILLSLSPSVNFLPNAPNCSVVESRRVALRPQLCADPHRLPSSSR